MSPESPHPVAGARTRTTTGRLSRYYHAAQRQSSSRGNREGRRYRGEKTHTPRARVRERLPARTKPGPGCRRRLAGARGPSVSVALLLRAERRAAAAAATEEGHYRHLSFPSSRTLSSSLSLSFFLSTAESATFCGEQLRTGGTEHVCTRVDVIGMEEERCV